MPENPEYGIVPSFKPERYVWIKQRIQFDLLSIDDEVAEIAVLIQQAGEITSEAIELRETAKDELEVSISQAAESLRNAPTPNGKSRSETAITSQVYLSANVQAKQNALSEARLDASLWQAIVESLRSKNSAIRVVADLLNSGFLTRDYILTKRRQELRNR